MIAQKIIMAIIVMIFIYFLLNTNIFILNIYKIYVYIFSFLIVSIVFCLLILKIEYFIITNTNIIPILLIL